MTISNWDMFIYLMALQAWPFLHVWRHELSGTRANWGHLILWQSVLFAIFWLVWAGYSVDGWKYLTRFDRDPYRFESEQLFWILGHYLDKVFVNPWPLKVMAAGCASLCIYFVYLWHRKAVPDDYLRLTVISILLLIWIPGIYLLFGNVIRQGIGAMLVLAGGVFAVRKSYLSTIAIWGLAIFFHEMSVVLMAAFLIAAFLPRVIIPLLVLAPVAGVLLPTVFDYLKIESSQFIPYTDRTTGYFHYAKFLVSYALAWGALYSGRWREFASIDARKVYAACVAIASIVLVYEVAFERLLLYSDLVLPVAIVTAVFHPAFPGLTRRYILIAFAVAGCTLWLLPSISISLGYQMME